MTPIDRRPPATSPATLAARSAAMPTAGPSTMPTAASAFARLRRAAGWAATAVVASWLSVAFAAGSPTNSSTSAAAVASPAARAVDDASVPASVIAVGRRGFLYEVVAHDADPGGRTGRLFLYGTIHVGRAGDTPFNAPLVRALGASRRLALEADPTDAATSTRLVTELGLYVPPDALDRHVPPALMARVRAFAAGMGLPPGRVAQMKPWLAATLVVVRRVAESGLSPELGTENDLVGFAKKAGLPIDEVEGVETQLRLLAGLSEPLQVAELDEALDESTDDADVDGRRIFAIWINGDTAGAERLIDELHRDAASKSFERWFLDTLVDGRNRAMADRAERALAEPGPTFFAVGALHLFGPTGLVRELARRGYRVTDLQAAPPAQ